MDARLGRTVYEQTCQVCHGTDLKGDRGPSMDRVVSRLGADEVMTWSRMDEARCRRCLRYRRRR